ncbi:dolichyl-phosphate beta-glucosyltransferase isoform X6 [Egretta garzetta]|uniref:dolichyl-phosphate beta-glucosyltransferase isoform X6 n=1 Tax=Egretta garzetta TaxID=188379 RepID=UPI00163C2601|nr:dolichyl-phosphate beta-glucosyltransferase isoform X6 [Egretta garzetta]XP_035756180.1 dolichyl-phosphate beta-glucosyltransferase isoform X6 [Egretta garzetta]XP_035756188.1 dolichyl-phosphate beta-glucosyltransferase isoform X6 [Egretta garzetta]XP_035756196.1 dolichyl-phosphate beta-glucosyltransferase isoform X6 [Egretta garzetta]
MLDAFSHFFAFYSQVCMIAHVTARNMPTLHRHEEEKFFINDEGRKESLPSIHDPATRELSVVVPSYNEEDRCKIFLVLRKRRKSICCYSNNAEKRDPSFTYEVIVVDDGSKDQTTKVAMKYCRKYGSDKVRVLTLVKNRGKGGAVRMGVFSSRGEKILMADADGATKFADIEKVEEGLKNLQPWPNQMAISCGSRAHLEKDSIAKSSSWNLFKCVFLRIAVFMQSCWLVLHCLSSALTFELFLCMGSTSLCGFFVSKRSGIRSVDLNF